MLVRSRTCAINGIEAVPIDVEIEVRRGHKRCFSILGVGGTVGKEARERIAAAIRHSGYTVPTQVIVSLTPAEVRKEGASFDLAIALGVLRASGQVSIEGLDRSICQGELSLDGAVRSVRGVIAAALTATSVNAERFLVPTENFTEASCIEGLRIQAVESLRDAVESFSKPFSSKTESLNGTDSDVKTRAHNPFLGLVGQHEARRALTVAAAGGHNLLMIGPPGCGKSMLAGRLRYLLPRLGSEERLEVIQAHSICGEDLESVLAGVRPFRDPHHGISLAGLVGGGPNLRPGELALAHRGVLFLDEFPEFPRQILEALRIPLERRWASINRANGAMRYPCDLQLIAAMNPCPCGRTGVPGQQCRCDPGAVERYRQRLSQPILDRIDLQVELDPVPIEMVVGTDQNEPQGGAELIESVASARNCQLARQGSLNATLERDELSTSTTQAALRLLSRCGAGLSARGAIRVLRVARTIADLDRTREIIDEHVAEALGYRRLDALRG